VSKEITYGDNLVATLAVALLVGRETNRRGFEMISWRAVDEAYEILDLVQNHPGRRKPLRPPPKKTATEIVL
jgi:hypothetical protein